MGFDDGPDPLPLDFFEPLRGEAEPGGQPLFALNPLAELVVGFHPSRLSTVPAAVQQTGRLLPGFWSDAPHAPDFLGRALSLPAPLGPPSRQLLTHEPPSGLPGVLYRTVRTAVFSRLIHPRHS